MRLRRPESVSTTWLLVIVTVLGVVLWREGSLAVRIRVVCCLCPMRPSRPLKRCSTWSGTAIRRQVRSRDDARQSLGRFQVAPIRRRLQEGCNGVSVYRSCERNGRTSNARLRPIRLTSFFSHLFLLHRQPLLVLQAACRLIRVRSTMAGLLRIRPCHYVLRAREKARLLGPS